MTTTNSHELPQITLTLDTSTNTLQASPTTIADRKYNSNKDPAVWIQNSSGYTATVCGNESAEVATIDAGAGAEFKAKGVDTAVQIEVTVSGVSSAAVVNLSNHLVLTTGASGELIFSVDPVGADCANYTPNLRVHNATDASQTLNITDTTGTLLKTVTSDSGSSMGVGVGTAEGAYLLCVGDPDPVITVNVPPCDRSKRA